ncbi:MAG: winged helix-turn-helix transcriptional regulator [Chloroflexota bacterium]|nr:winged helix-turn-helix transcriptional regulator [Chloroflexota bacterium]
MAQVLKSKNLSSKFQILLEVAAGQPNVQQKDIARKLDITSQAVSAYVKELIDDGWLISQGRSRYRVTREGVDWILRMTRQLNDYSFFAGKVVRDISISTAIADDDLSEGQPVMLYMKDGLLFASADMGIKGARGIAVSGAREGTDVGVSGVEGMIKLEPGRITVCQVPSIPEGGSQNADLRRLKTEVARARVVGAIGIEALVALRRVGREPDYLYGVRGAAIEAAHCGLSFLVLCAEDEFRVLVQRLEEEKLNFVTIDLKKRKRSNSR